MQFINNIISKIRFDSELKEDIFKMGIMFSVSRAFKDGHLRSLDNKKFLTETFAVLAGFAVYHLIVKDYASKIQLQNATLQKLVQIGIKVATVLAVPKLLKGKQLNVYTGSYIIAGFASHAILKDCVDLSGFFDDYRFKKVADDFIFAIFTTIIPRIVKGGRITRKVLMEVVAKTIGFAAYDFLLA